MNINETAARLLVDVGYALEYGKTTLPHQPDKPVGYWISILPGDTYFHEYVDPFTDTLESRRQADALETAFAQGDDDKTSQYHFLWRTSKHHVNHLADKPGIVFRNRHQWRLDRIKWCLEQLAK